MSRVTWRLVLGSRQSEAFCLATPVCVAIPGAYFGSDSNFVWKYMQWSPQKNFRASICTHLASHFTDIEWLVYSYFSQKLALTCRAHTEIAGHFVPICLWLPRLMWLGFSLISWCFLSRFQILLTEYMFIHSYQYLHGEMGVFCEAGVSRKQSFEASVHTLSCNILGL